MGADPTADETDLNQSGEIVAEVPITGIILPPLSCLTSDRNAASVGPSASVRITSGLVASDRRRLGPERARARGRASGWTTSVSPAFLIAAIAGAMNVCEPMSLPKARATLL